ncbi:glycosyltransferase [Cyclobacterium salsum]|uniref:glycosyltransferase n=1 Tax=Cyclobacterium salsum TaxID=2666329 RepID=UPI0013914E6C|nr:glycosyltransferase [Cyclobacterium salsum]
MKLSVIICTHNPRTDYLTRVLNNLRNQTLNLHFWELLIIDNGSKIPVSERFNLLWHPDYHYIREDNLGLIPARIRGINEATADYILFVDDDNCLEKNYLALALQTMESNPLLGVLGAGKILPEYEEEPSLNIQYFSNMLALRDEKRSYYSSEINWNKAIPYGAGMFIRRCIALDYVSSYRNRMFTKSLGRIGNVLLSGDDVDLALHACKNQYLAGVIPELEVIHLIPKKRLASKYLIEIAKGHAYSHYILGKIWGYNKDYRENFILKKLRYFKKWIKCRGVARSIMVAEHKAISDARMAWNKTVEVK